MNYNNSRANSDERVPPVRYVPVALAVFAGLVVSLCVLLLWRDWEWRQIRSEFQYSADRCASALIRQAQNDLLILESPRGFFYGSDEVTRQEFHAFAEPFVERLAESRLWAWVPRIESASRAACEAAAHNDGLKTFAIWEFDANGAGVPAGQRKEYFPVYYVEPCVSNAAVLGFDEDSDPTRAAALRQSRDSGEVVATPAVPLIQAPGERLGRLVFVPVFKGGRTPSTVAERREKLQGFVLASFFVDQLLDAALANVQPDGFFTSVQDLTNPESAKAVGCYPLDEERETGARGSGSDAIGGGLRQITQFSAAGRQWQIQSTVPSSYITAKRTWQPWAVLPVGLALSALLAANLLAGIRRSVRVEQLVVQRTRELSENEQMFRTISDAALSAVVMIDPRGTVVHWNPAAKAIFGYSKEEMLGRPVHETLAPESHRSGAIAHQAHFAQSGQGAAAGAVLELTALRKDGSEFPIELSLSGIPMDGGWGAVAIIQDITPRKAAEEERRQRTLELESANRALKAAIREVEAANAAKSAFLANMSHELRTPLHAVLSFATFGVKRAHIAAGDELHEYFELIHQSGTTLLSLVDNLLDLAKLEAGHMHFDMAAVDLAAIVPPVVSELGEVAAARGIRIEVAGSTANCRITADGPRLSQVIRNLLSNAIKFSPVGGTVEIEFSERADAVAVCVRDRGVGIPEGELEAIFDEFVQSSKTRTGSGGTGLGLAICRQIVAGHGGRIWAENRTGGGAAFIVELPREHRCACPAVESGTGSLNCASVGALT